MTVLRFLAVACILGAVLSGGAWAFLVSNSSSGGVFVYESIPAARRPVDLLVDTEAVPGVADPVAVTADLVGQWNDIPEAADVFGNVSAGGPYNGSTVRQTFGTFTNTRYEVAFDDDGSILAEFGIGVGVLGITLKSVGGGGNLQDFLIVINTTGPALSAPGTGATQEQLFRSTLLHELGHAAGIGHTPVGMANTATGFGKLLAAPSQVPTMYPFRLPQQPQQGATIEGDDRAALIDAYPLDRSGLGSISGRVRGLSGAPVNEIHVRALGPQGQGQMHYGALTNGDGADLGRYRIANLPPGAYQLVMETVNGRASVDADAIGGPASLGGNPFVRAADEFWQLGDTADPATDDPDTGTLIHVRAGMDSGNIDFVLDANPLGAAPVAGTLVNGDDVVPDALGGFHFVDYYVFAATAGDDVTLSVASTGFGPELRILSPQSLSLLFTDAPVAGTSAQIAFTAGTTGVYTAMVSARATTGNPGGFGTYSVTLQGATGALPQPPAATPASAAVGAANPGAQQFASPIRDITMLQLRLAAPALEQLWVDQVTVRAGGSGDDLVDLDAITLVRDLDGDGRRGGNEPVLGTGVYSADDGTIVFADLGLTIAAGGTMDLIVEYDATVTSVSSQPAATGVPPAWLLLVVLVALVRKRRALALILLCALVPAACGGGGGGGGFNGPFDPAGAIVTFQARVEAGDVVAFTPTTDPASPLSLPGAAIASGTLSLSN
jgi:hypothetical protein